MDLNEEIIICGGNKLKGTVQIEGAKNTILPIMAGIILVEEGSITLNNCPIISDVFNMLKLMERLNVDTIFDQDTKSITINSSHRELFVDVPADLVVKLRGSTLVMGPLLARTGHVRFHSTPGGCVIGKRPIDLHLKGFESLGAKIEYHEHYTDVVIGSDGLVGTTIELTIPSVGATENIMMAATKARGKTIIKNAARDPEVSDFADFLILLGAKVYGAGTDTICIEGTTNFSLKKDITYFIPQDRHEAGTFMIAAALTKGNILIEGAVPKDNDLLITKLIEMGADISFETKGIRVIGPKNNLKPTNIKAESHPGFPTDLQAPMTILQMVAEGVSTMEETVFEDRYHHIDEMKKMNANIKVIQYSTNIAGSDGYDSCCDDRSIRTSGKFLEMHQSTLKGAVVYGSDLRSTAALILAGLKATGMTCVKNLHYLDRGYYQFHKKLEQLGADIKRVKVQHHCNQQEIHSSLLEIGTNVIDEASVVVYN